MWILHWAPQPCKMRGIFLPTRTVSQRPTTHYSGCPENPSASLFSHWEVKPTAPAAQTMMPAISPPVAPLKSVHLTETHHGFRHYSRRNSANARWAETCAVKTQAKRFLAGPL